MLATLGSSLLCLICPFLSIVINYTALNFNIIATLLHRLDVVVNCLSGYAQAP
jgi:hypothetical protein